LICISRAICSNLTRFTPNKYNLEFFSLSGFLTFETAFFSSTDGVSLEIWISPFSSIDRTSVSSGWPSNKASTASVTSGWMATLCLSWISTTILKVGGDVRSRMDFWVPLRLASSSLRVTGCTFQNGFLGTPAFSFFVAKGNGLNSPNQIGQSRIYD